MLLSQTSLYRSIRLRKSKTNRGLNPAVLRGAGGATGHQRLLASNRVSLDALANGLLEREVLSGAELETLLGERLAPMPMAG